MKQLTEKQKKDYMKDPTLCPNCKSDKVHQSDKWEDIISVYEEWNCSECKKWWIDTYTLTNVELVG